ncbi:hypothetical protein IPG41_03905 [Candidatus Peregrinibacteria bacterium]|nr:MAG: hypothetical protein IPG41_03905 [Candidatus Peregrinibacteria bacterium]
MPETNLPESNEGNSVISGLARLAQEVIGGARKEVDMRLDERNARLAERLGKVAEAFGENTDPDATSYDMGAKQLKAVVNLVCTLFNLDPLSEDETVDASRNLIVEEGKPSRLKIGDKEVQFKDIDFSKIKDLGNRIVEAGMTSIAMKERVYNRQGKAGSCWDWVDRVYDAAGVKAGPVLYQEKTANHPKAIGRLDHEQIVPGAWLYIWNGNPYGGEHSVIFKKWIDKAKGTAEVMSFPGSGSKKAQRVHVEDFNKHRVTRLCVPKAK